MSVFPAHIFTFSPADALVGQLATMPAAAGTYIVLIRAGDRLLELAGYFDHHERLPYQRRGFYHLYTGCGRIWSRRVKHHLTGSFGSSNLRWTLHALDAAAEVILRSGVTPWCHSDVQERITRWLLTNALVGVCECENPWMLEKALLEGEPSPLNIDQRRSDPFAQRIIAARADALMAARGGTSHAKAG